MRAMAPYVQRRSRRESRARSASRPTAYTTVGAPVGNRLTAWFGGGVLKPEADRVVTPKVGCRGLAGGPDKASTQRVVRGRPRARSAGGVA